MGVSVWPPFPASPVVAWAFVAFTAWYAYLLLRHRDAVMAFQYLLLTTLIARLAEVAVVLR